MSKIIPLQEIRGMAELRAMVGSDSAYAAKLEEMQNLLDAINDRIGVMNTITEAELMKLGAEEHERSAVAALTDAGEVVKRAKADAVTKTEIAEKVLTKAKDTQTKVKKELQAASRAIKLRTERVMNSETSLAEKAIAVEETVVAAKKKYDKIKAREKELRAGFKILKGLFN